MRPSFTGSIYTLAAAGAACFLFNALEVGAAELPSASGPGPSVTSSTAGGRGGVGAPRPTVSGSPSPGTVAARSSPSPGGVELVGATVPTVGLPPTRSSGPAPTPSATATGSTGVPSPSPSPSSSGTGGQQGVTLDGQLTPTPAVSVGVRIGALDAGLGL